MGPLTMGVVKLGSPMTLLVIVGLEVMIGEKVVCLVIVCPNAGMAAESIVAVNKYFFMSYPPWTSRTLQSQIFKFQSVCFIYNLKYSLDAFA